MADSSVQSEDPGHKTQREGDGASPPFVVCLGASAGGLEALEAFFDEMSPDSGASFVVVVHLSPDFKSALPELLSRRTSMPVSAAKQDQALKPNHIHIIPPRFNMVLKDGRLQLREQDRAHGINLPIDTFLESLADEFGDRAIALILSGTGSDGTRGLGRIKGAGGLVFVQDPTSAKFDGMPQSALGTGVVDAVDVPSGLARRVARVSRSVGQVQTGTNEEDVQSELAKVLDIIRSNDAPDLRHYRRSMVTRRVQRRMTLGGIVSIDDYLEKLMSSSDERSQLRNDLLIGVTDFFRDKTAFEALRARFMGSAVSRLDPSEPVRIWVPACSTGQEVYSIAMLCAEINAAQPQRKFKIFATDVHHKALDVASRGIYTLSEVDDVPPLLLKKYFSAQGQFHISRDLREMVIFARHDLVRDPPFTKMHLVSCRNFQIYLEPETQEQILASLHFSLNPNGMLFLGNSESISPLDAEFEVVDQSARIFRKATTAAHPALRRRGGLVDPISVVPRTVAYTQVAAEPDDVARSVLDHVLESGVVTCALLTADGHIIEIFSDPNGLFRMSKGKPTNDAIKIVPKEVSVALTTGLHRIKRGEQHVNYAVDVSSIGLSAHATVQMHKCAAGTEELANVILTLHEVEESSSAPVSEKIDLSEAESERMIALESDLRHTKETLQATIEELQTTNEEQQSTNEELVAANEELQSTNEELQSVNEELHTVNVELQRKNEDLSVLTADLDNLLQNIEVGTLFLDRNLSVRKFTVAIGEIINLTAHDIGRSIEDFSHNLSIDFSRDLRHVIDTGQRVDKQVAALGGAWYHMRIVPYQTKLGADEGVLVTFIDVTGTKNMEELTISINEQLQDANQRLLEQTTELEDLFSITSHDLKRPLAAMDGLLKMSLRKKGGQSDAKRRENIELALAECARMNRMIRDLAHVSGIREPDDVEEELDLQDWMDSIIGDYRAAADERNILLNYSCDRGSVTLVRTAPEQALRNIIENAILYGSDSDKPRIDVACQLDKNTLRLSVADNGKGIAEEHHERVFELFRRLDPSVGDGSGVGLVAARRLISKAGGTVNLQSESGAGAKFTIKVPVNRIADGRQETDRQHVLIVEDDTVDAKSAMRHLDSSYRLTWATTLMEAKDLVQSEVFDAVLLDLSLPDGHGLELLTQLRKNLHSDVPIVILTGHSGIVEEKSLRASTDGYLTKAAAQQQSILLGAIEDAIVNRQTNHATGSYPSIST